MSWRKIVVFTTSFHVGADGRQHRGEIRHHALGLRAHVARHDLTRRRIERDLTGGEEETVGDDALRIRTDGGGA